MILKPDNRNHLRKENPGTGSVPKFRAALRKGPVRRWTVIEHPLKDSIRNINPVLLLAINLSMNHIVEPNSSAPPSTPADLSHPGNRIETYRLAVTNGEDSIHAGSSPLVWVTGILVQPVLKIARDVRAIKLVREPASPGNRQAGQEGLINLEIALHKSRIK